MLIDKALIEKILPVKAHHDFMCLTLGHIGFVTHKREKMLVFCEGEKYLPYLEDPNIVAVLTTDALAERVLAAGKVPIVSASPKHHFQLLRDYVGREEYKLVASQVDPSASISPRAFVAQHNVRIGRNTIVEPNATILPGVEIGDDCFIGAGTVLGTAFDSKLSANGIAKNFHDGKLVIGNDVEIHSNCCLDKGNFFHGDTVIGNHCRISHLSYIGHSSSLGEFVFVMTKVSIAGAVIIGDRVTIDPGCNICSYVKIGAGARITTGSMVAYDVAANARVTGYFAIPHDQFKALRGRS
jgi:UDP-3-O-[3-hydroxymyristoyl] glucosamine N-acyltransferase